MFATSSETLCFVDYLFVDLWLKMTFCGSWRCCCLHEWEMKLTGQQPTMSYSVSLYCNSRILLQFLFLLPRWKFSWPCVSIWTIYNPVITLR